MADRGVTHANLPRADADPERRPVLIKGRLGGTMRLSTDASKFMRMIQHVGRK